MNEGLSVGRVLGDTYVEIDDSEEDDRVIVEIQHFQLPYTVHIQQNKISLILIL
jgi:hypothetical protein